MVLDICWPRRSVGGILEYVRRCHLVLRKVFLTPFLIGMVCSPILLSISQNAGANRLCRTHVNLVFLHEIIQAEFPRDNRITLVPLQWPNHCRLYHPLPNYTASMRCLVKESKENQLLLRRVRSWWAGKQRNCADTNQLCDTERNLANLLYSKR